MFKKERNDVFSRGQRLIGKMRAFTKKYSASIREQIEENEYIDSETKKLFKDTQELMDECCSFADSYIFYEKSRQAQLNRIDQNIETIKGLLEAKA